MDVSTYPDLDISGRTLDEDDSILQCLHRGLDQSAGKLAYAPEDGFPLRALLSRGIDPARIFVIESKIEDQAKLDERISAAKASLSLDGERLVGTVQVVKRDGQSLRLTLTADRVTVALLRGT